MKNAPAVVDKGSVIRNLFVVEKRIMNSDESLNKMVSNLKTHKNLVAKAEKKAKDKWFTNSPNNSELFDLIKHDQKSNSRSVSDIGKMIKSVNENTHDLSKMIHGLISLSTLSYEDMGKGTTELRKVKEELLHNSTVDSKTQNQLTSLIELQITKAQKTHEKEIQLKKEMNDLRANVEDLTNMNEFLQANREVLKSDVNVLKNQKTNTLKMNVLLLLMIPISLAITYLMMEVNHLV